MNIGDTLNYLTIIDGPIMKGTTKKRTYWKCRCICGVEKEVRQDCLKSGKTKSCGCYKNQVFLTNAVNNAIDLANQKFGKLIALEPTNQRNNDGRIIWKCQCECGNIAYVDTHCLQEGKTKSCGCMRSKGEWAITNLLQQYSIPYRAQATFDTCVFPDTKYLARFDFYIDDKYIIEYDGEQRFYHDNGKRSWNNPQNYEIVQQHDNFKNDWCKINNIPIIRIPYTHFDKITIEDLKLETSTFIL